MPNSLTYGLTHLSLAVTRIERTLQFYQAVFDMEIMYHSKDFLQLSTPGRNDVLVFERKENAAVGKSGGIAHFGFRLVDPGSLETIRNNVIRARGVIIDSGEFVKGSPYIFFRDPDGYIIEVWYELL